MRSPTGRVWPTVLVPQAQSVRRAMGFLIRTGEDPLGLAPAVRAAMADVDPDLALDRMATMEAGHFSGYEDPAALFVYTATQELATRVSHRNAGRLADDETAYALMARIATDENHHFLFYRGVASEMLEQSPETMLEPIFRVFDNFKMPGTVVPGFVRRAVDMARVGVYSLRIHHDRVLEPLLRDWRIEHLTGLSAKAREFQEKIMEIPDRVLKAAEIFERRTARLAGSS